MKYETHDRVSFCFWQIWSHKIIANNGDLNLIVKLCK